LNNEFNSTHAYSKTSVSERDIVNIYISNISNLQVKIKEKELKLSIMYWIPKLHKKNLTKPDFIANSTSSNTCKRSILLTSCLIAIKSHVIRYCDNFYENTGKHLFWSIKNSGEILEKFKIKNFQALAVRTHDFSTLYTTLPHKLINDKLISLIQ
jgi:hypothetical protein